tara:strand:- start:2853 stop:3878 length:1026 start_codon:yes stop_codon:yes gene_type:complete
MKKPFISIITPTFNRCDEVCRLIKSIDAQTLDHSLFEHIISDDGSTDDTINFVSKLKDEIKFQLYFITQSNQGPGAARNHGVENSLGELILFIDSDCEADENWLEIIYNTYLKSPFGACGGPDASKADFTAIQKAIDYSMTSFLTTGGMRGHSEKMMAKFYPRSHNMGMTKILYDKVGGFGSLRHGQDIELSNRIHKSGTTIKFIKNAIVYHRRRTTIRQFFKQVFNWGVARFNLFRIDKQMLEPIHLIPSISLIFFIFFIIIALIGYRISYYILQIGIVMLMLLSLWGGIKRKSLAVALLLPIIVPIQIGGYGLGFIWAFISSFLFGKNSMVGFVNKYYE